MKRFLILALVVTIAGLAFAEVDPAFSGTFSTYFGLSVVDMDVKKDVSDAMKLDLNATIDEWNTVSVTVEVADALYWDDINDDKNIATSRLGTDTTKLAVAGDELDNRQDYLRMGAYTLTTDLFGALGISGPVGLSLKLGKFGFGDSASVVNVAPLSTKSADGTKGTDDGLIGIGFDFKFVDKVTLSTVIYPENLGAIGKDSKKRFEGGVTLKGVGIADMLDFAAYFLASDLDARKKENKKSDTKDDGGMSVGASVALGFGDHKVGLGFQYDLDDALAPNGPRLQLDYSAKFGILTAGLSYGIEGIEAFGEKSKVKVSLLADVLDNLSIFGGIELGDFENFDAANIKYDAGISTALGSLSILFGMTNNMDYKAPEDDWNDTIYLKFSTAF